MNRFGRTSLLLILLLALSVADSWARLDGTVEWGYAHYEESSDSGGDWAASHFTQRYSLLYSMKGLIAGGRAGSYDFGAGAEWAAFNTDLDGEEVSMDTFKPLYRGSLQIAPGGLPFRLNAYSYDMDKVYFERYNMLGGYSSGGAFRTGQLLSPFIVTSMTNGQSVVSGIQFIGGIRNGSYLGKYRDALSQWPRLLVDYRDVYRRDLESASPQNYRDRNLAFVSLNKKDNWFHYRINTHTDYLDSRYDSHENIIMLGTIDHTLKRQWINLTNWIRISADGSYTEYEQQWDRWATERFDINFFTVMERSKFTASSFANMQRIKEGPSLEYFLDLPAYVTQNINPDTSVRSTFQLWRNKRMREDVADQTNADSYYGRVLLETHKRNRVRIDPSIEMEVHTGDVGEGEAIRGRVEVYSNLLRRQAARWYGMSSLALFGGTSQDDEEVDEEVDLWEAELNGGVNVYLPNNMSVGGDQYLLYGEGSYSSDTAHFMSAAVADGFQRNSSRGSGVTDGSVFRSTTNLYFEHTSRSRINNRLGLLYKFEDNEGGRLYALELSHKLNYRSQRWRVSLEHIYSTGDDRKYEAQRGYLEVGAAVQSSDEQLTQRGTVEFNPNKYWKSRLETSVIWGRGQTGQESLLLHARQEIKRTFFASSAVQRIRGDITQSLLIEQFNSDSTDRRAAIFSLTGNYYPTTFWRLGAGVFYNHYDYADNSIYYSLTSGLDFPLFKVDFRYDYGTRSSSDNVVAHRYEVNVRKIF